MSRSEVPFSVKWRSDQRRGLLFELLGESGSVEEALPVLSTLSRPHGEWALLSWPPWGVCSVWDLRRCLHIQGWVLLRLRRENRINAEQEVTLDLPGRASAGAGAGGPRGTLGSVRFASDPPQSCPWGRIMQRFASARQELKDVVLYLCDTCTTLWAFLDIFPLACPTFQKHDFCYRYSVAVEVRVHIHIQPIFTQNVPGPLFQRPPVWRLHLRRAFTGG